MRLRRLAVFAVTAAAFAQTPTQIDWTRIKSKPSVSTTSPLSGGGSLAGSLSLACPTCVVTSASYSNPGWIVSIAGSKVSGDIAGKAATAGNADTATALAANGANCSTGAVAGGVDASGAAEDCIEAASADGPNTIVRRDGTGNFAANVVTATLSGNASTATELEMDPDNCAAGSVAGGVDAAGVAEDCIASTDANTASAIVRRDVSGNFSAGTITATLTGNVTGNADTATALAANGSNCAAGSVAGGVDASGAAEDCIPTTNANTASAIVRRDANGDFSAGAVGLTSLAMSAQPHAQVYNSAPHTIAHNTWTALTFNTEAYDVGDCHSTTTNTEYLYVPAGQGGVYLVIANVTFAANATGIRGVSIIGPATYTKVQIPSAGASDQTGIQSVALVPLSAGDAVSVWAFQTSGGDLGTVAALQDTWIAFVKLF